MPGPELADRAEPAELAVLLRGRTNEVGHVDVSFLGRSEEGRRHRDVADVAARKPEPRGEEVEVESPNEGYPVLPKDVTAEIGTIKLFNKWSYEDVEIRDISLT